MSVCFISSADASDYSDGLWDFQTRLLPLHYYHGYYSDGLGDLDSYYCHYHGYYHCHYTTATATKLLQLTLGSLRRRRRGLRRARACRERRNDRCTMRAAGGRRRPHRPPVWGVVRRPHALEVACAPGHVLVAHQWGALLGRVGETTGPRCEWTRIVDRTHCLHGPESAKVRVGVRSRARACERAGGPDLARSDSTTVG